MYIYDYENHEALISAKKLSKINLKEYLSLWLAAIQAAKTTLLNSSYYNNQGQQNG